MVESERRHFENRLADYSLRSEDLVTRNGTLSSHFREDVQKLGEKLFAEWEHELKNSSSGVSGESVYTGIAGPALLYYHLFNKSNVSFSRVYRAGP